MVNISDFQKVKINEPLELILTQIRNLIENGKLKPGDKLPSQTLLSKKFGVKRNQVRDALMKLEIFEVIKNKPQNGTYITDIGEIVLIGLITNILNEEDGDDFNSLIEARRIVEVRIAEMVAKYATNDEINEIVKYHKDLSTRIHSGSRGLDEDIYWHIKLANFSKNYFLKKIMMLLAPKIIEYSRKYTISSKERLEQLLKEHWEIVKAIMEKNEKKAGEAMNAHMEMTMQMNRPKTNKKKGGN